MNIKFNCNIGRWVKDEVYDIPVGLACVYLDRRVAVRVDVEGRETASRVHSPEKANRGGRER
jgi:hypothetical protein